MKFHKKILLALILLGIFVASFLIGCGQKSEEPKKVRDLEFTVVQESELPEQLKLLIGEKKCNPFKLTYAGSDALYIVQGYGAQPTGAYSVTIQELWLAENAIYFCSELLEPKEGARVEQRVSYPYVVVKMEWLDLPVVFEADKNISFEGARYRPGIYYSDIILNEYILNLELTVDRDCIKSVSITNLDEEILSVYPLIEPALQAISEQLIGGVAIDAITISEDSKHTQIMLVFAIDSMLERATLSTEK